MSRGKVQTENWSKGEVWNVHFICFVQHSSLNRAFVSLTVSSLLPEAPAYFGMWDIMTIEGKAWKGIGVMEQ